MKNSDAMKAAMDKIGASDLMDIDGDEEKPKVVSSFGRRG